MGTTCPECGGLSQDLEFCDHCNADLAPPGGELPPERCPVTPVETVSLSAAQRALLSRPEASVVLHGQGSSWRVHWITRIAWEQWQTSITDRVALTCPALPPCRLVEEPNGVWVMAETTSRPATPWTATAKGPIEDLLRLSEFLKRLAGTLEDLHACGLTCLTFHPLELEEASAGGPLRFTNMDLQVYPAGRLPERLQVVPAFAPPEVSRFQSWDIGPATDVFHLALFAYYWLAGLLPQGFPGKGLEAFGHAFPPVRTFAADLPPGISAVLGRGLTLEPRQRFPTPAAFVAALDKVLGRAQQRWNTVAPLAWDIGQHTRTGRTKTALKRDNEDYILVRHWQQPDRALAVVADGITSCDVGSGALASWITCLMLENAVDGSSSRETFPHLIADVCRRGSETLLNWALEKGYRGQLAAGRDLMGSTLLAGWLEGNRLTLANVGDSRAYLIDGGNVEQLTVDGDLGSELLADGMPPEEVKALGALARGLRDCIGGCSVTPAGEPDVLHDFSRPVMSSWPLLPGDVVVLCSDGLVEEGVFLEPEKLRDIVGSHPHLSAQALAEQLAQAADALQRLPTPLEPDGFGDNISCIVIRVRIA
jgi:protein phosphatase